MADYVCAGRCKRERDTNTSGAILTTTNKLFCPPCFKSAIQGRANGSDMRVYKFSLPEGMKQEPSLIENKSLKIYGETGDKGYFSIGQEVECEFGLFLTTKHLSDNDRILGVGYDTTLDNWNMELRTQPSFGEEFVKTSKQVLGLCEERFWVG